MYHNFQKFKDTLKDTSFINDTEAVLLYLRESFPKNEVRFPPIHFLHQVYAILKNKTRVDREASDLQASGKAILYKLGGDKDNIAEIIVLYDDIKSHIMKHSNSKVVKQFVEVLPSIKNLSVDSAYLRSSFAFSESNIRELVQESVLVIQDVGSYWLSFPRCGEFVKAYNIGRKEILRMVKKSKYSEMLEMELAKRKLSKKASLGINFHILDVIGSEAVKCINTTSGVLLRYDP